MTGLHLLLVAGGGFLGAVARYVMSKKIAERFQTAVPYGTLTVNLSGSFLLGLMIGSGRGTDFLLFAGTGFMGAYTTFSTFKLESVTLARQSQFGKFAGYMGVTYSLGLVLAYTGYCLGRLL